MSGNGHEYYETEAAKQEAIDTVKRLMAIATTDASCRAYAAQLEKILRRPVRPTRSWDEGLQR